MKVLNSVNFDNRTGAKIKYLIMHYTGMINGANALEKLCDPKSKVTRGMLMQVMKACIRLSLKYKWLRLLGWLRKLLIGIK